MYESCDFTIFRHINNALNINLIVNQIINLIYHLSLLETGYY